MDYVSPTLFEEEDDDASTVVTKPEDPMPSQLQHSSLPSTQTASQPTTQLVFWEVKARDKAKADEEGRILKAVNPQLGRTLTITAEMEEGLHDQQATMEAMDRSRPIAEQVIYMFTRDQEDALVDWFQDSALFYAATATRIMTDDDDVDTT